MLIIILLILSLISLHTIREAYRIIRQSERLCFIPLEMTTSSQSACNIGCSVICTSVWSVKHIEELLSTEYDKFEVVVVLDSSRHNKAFQRIIDHFHLIRVSCLQSEELPAAAIRQLYRSRDRALRRIVLVDRKYVTQYDDLNAATAVAAYDMIIPIGKDYHLHPQAIKFIISTLSEKRANNQLIELIYSSVMTRSYVFYREAIIRLGGFSANILKQIPQNNISHIYVPICYREPILGSLVLRIIANTIFMAGSLTLLFGALPTIAFLSCLALQWTYIRLVSNAFYGKKCSTQARLCYLSLKWDFFNARKFTIS